MKYRVRYEADPAAVITVNLIRTWQRGEIEPVMSASSGPKDYLRNHVWFVFDRFPLVARVHMLKGLKWASPPFLLVANAAGEVWDMAGKPVLMEEQP